MVAREKDRRKGQLGSLGWTCIMHTALFKMDNQQGPTVWHMGPLLNVMWQPGWEGSLGQNGYMYICVAESLGCSPKTITLLIGYLLLF